MLPIPTVKRSNIGSNIPYEQKRDVEIISKSSTKNCFTVNLARVVEMHKVSFNSRDQIKNRNEIMRIGKYGQENNPMSTRKETKENIIENINKNKYFMKVLRNMIQDMQMK